MTELVDFARVASGDHGLCIASALRPDNTIHSSLVNAGVLPHPTLGHDIAAFVAIGGSRKLRYLRDRPHATLTARTGWNWASVDGTVELIGPDDLYPDVDGERLRVLLREIFTAAGGTHEDWPTYDRVMAEERRTAVLITPGRVYSNN